MAPVQDLELVELVGPADFAEASRLYVETFGYDDARLTLNPLLLVALVENGGVAVGARDGDGALLGFAYGFPGHRDGLTYLYSQAAVVAPAAQGRGLGRRLKEVQRAAALERGLTRMRWAYDPLLARNAHFNLGVLGAVGVEFRADYYRTPGSDRIVVEWDLTAAAPAAVPAAVPLAVRPGVPGPEALAALRGAPTGTVLEVAEGLAVALPASVPAGASADALGAQRAALRGALLPAMERGLLAVDCVRLDGASAAYVLAAVAP
jgi:predicted GNAT superfamily acetyltransferase